MKFYKPEDLIKKNLIVKVRAGSYAYGTNVDTSDEDYRGIFCAEPIQVRTPFFKIHEASDTSEADTKFYEVSRFLQLYVDCNPNIVELLWTDEADVISSAGAYEHLRKYRTELLSSKAAFTFSGYALAQLKRIRGHNKWIANPQSIIPPHQVDYVSLVQWFGAEKLLKFSLRDSCFSKSWRLIPYGGDIFGLVPKFGYTPFNAETGSLNTVFEDDHHAAGKPVAILKFNKDVYKTDLDRWNQYWEWKRNRNVARSELEEKHGYDCYLEDTEFLTDNGWKKYEDIDSTVKLATLNRKTLSVQYQPYIDRFDGIFNMSPYLLQGTHMEVAVTPNHRMLIRRKERRSQKVYDLELLQASLLPDTFEVIRSVNPIKKRYKNLDLKSIKIGDMAFMRLCGWFLSDGSIMFSKKNPKAIVISQKDGGRLHWNMSRFYNKWKTVIKCSINTYKCKANEFRKEDINEVRLIIYDKSIAEKIYKEYGHSKEKRIPRYVFDLSLRLKSHLLDAMIGGDGTFRNHKTKSESIIYYSSLKTLADDVNELAFLCGFETSLWGPYHYEDRDLTMYQVHIRKDTDQYRQCIRHQNVSQLEFGPYRVVCFAVPNETLITRRNGNISIHGNSKHAMHLVRLLRMGVEILRDQEVIVKRPDAQELLDIRNGKWTYDQVVKYAEDMDKEVREVWYKKTSLPKKPDIHLAAKILIEVQDMMWAPHMWWEKGN